MDGADGSTAMDTMEDLETERVVDPLIAPTLAVSVDCPMDREVARPVEAMLATPPLLLVHTAA
jgi:hypothetical protein